MGIKGRVWTDTRRGKRLLFFVQVQADSLGLWRKWESLTFALNSLLSFLLHLGGPVCFLLCLYDGGMCFVSYASAPYNRIFLSTTCVCVNTFQGVQVLRTLKRRESRWDTNLLTSACFKIVRDERRLLRVFQVNRMKLLHNGRIG